MPIKLNVGLSRKVGEANYGSRGASVNLELEATSDLVQQPDKLQEHLRHLFHLAKTAVDEELNGKNGEAGRSSNGEGQPRSAARPATVSQARAIRAIASQRGLNLIEHLSAYSGAREPEELSITEASQLIDQLKSQTNGSGNGNGGRR